MPITPQEGQEPLGAGPLSLAKIAARGFLSLFRPQSSLPRGTNVALKVDVTSSDTLREKRVPRGQVETHRWPVLHAGTTPEVDLARWDLTLFGTVTSPVTFDWTQFRGLPKTAVFADMHCVTRWSKLNNTWEGVLVREVMKHVELDPKAKFVVAHAEHGFTTNLPLEDFFGDDCLFAWSHDGEALEPDHGWPLRLVVPRLYAWKSAKWLRGIEFLDHDEPGFWEQNGYHNHGDPWKEERFW